MAGKESLSERERRGKGGGVAGEPVGTSHSARNRAGAPSEAVDTLDKLLTGYEGCLAFYHDPPLVPLPRPPLPILSSTHSPPKKSKLVTHDVRCVYGGATFFISRPFNRPLPPHPKPQCVTRKMTPTK